MPSERARNIRREIFILALIVVGLAAARSTLANHYYVPSSSMFETLQIDDRVFVDMRAYGYRVPFTTTKLTEGEPVARGDIAVFDSPTDGTRLIKRIVAIGGDRVLIVNGNLSINGEWLRDPDDHTVEIFGDKRVQLNLRSGPGPDFGIVLEEGTVLAIGDHRGRSRDGRIFGPVPESEIYGRAVAVFYRSGDGFGWREL